MRWILGLLVVGIVFALTFFRFAPHDVDAVHTATAPQGVGDIETPNSFRAVRQFTTSTEEMLRAVDLVIAKTPRTVRLAGRVEDGLISYVTRSAVFGFPDYTTVWIDRDGPHLNIYSRARFGLSDVGVNKARIKDWLAQLGPLIVAPE